MSGRIVCCKSCPPEAQLTLKLSNKLLGLFLPFSSRKQTHRIDPTSLPCFDLWSAVGFVWEGACFGSFVISEEPVPAPFDGTGAFAFHLGGVGLAAAQARAGRMNGSAGAFCMVVE